MLIILAMCACPLFEAAFVPADMPSGWSHDAAASAVENGLLSGDGEGLLHPGDTIKGSELAAVMVRAFGANEKAELSEFTDVPPDAWYYDDMSYAVGAGWIKGDGDGHLMPEAPVSRVRFFTVTARTLNLPEGDPEILKSYPDGEDVPDWAQGAVSAMLEAGFVRGTDRGIEPDALITREAVCQVFYNIFDTYISKPGVYTGLKGSVLVSCDGVTIKDSALLNLCVGCGVANSVKLINSECASVLGNGAAIETASAAPASGSTRSGGGSGGGSSDPAAILRNALSHFNAHKNNYTVQKDGVQDLGRISVTMTEIINIDGAIEEHISVENETAKKKYIIDWNAGSVAVPLDDEYWYDGGDPNDYESGSMHGFSLNIDANWFEPASGGVFAVSEDHLDDAVKAMFGSVSDSYENTALSITVENGIISRVHTERSYKSEYTSSSETIDYTFTAYGRNRLSFPDTYELLCTSDLYENPQEYLGSEKFILDAGVIYSKDGSVFVGSADGHGTCTDAIPLAGDAEILSAAVAGKTYNYLAAFRMKEGGDGFFPYELVAEKSWTKVRTCTPFTDYESIWQLSDNLLNGPLPVNLLGVTATASGEDLILTDAAGDTARIPEGCISDAAKAALIGRRVNIEQLFAVAGDNNEILITTAPSFYIADYPQLNHSGLSFPVGTEFEDAVKDLAIVDGYTGSVICALGDEDMEAFPFLYEADTPGVYTVGVYYMDEYFGDVSVRLYESAAYTPAETSTIPRLGDLDTDNYIRPALPSVSPAGGQTNILVIPVAFKDSTYESPHLSDLSEYLDVCFNGTAPTGWYSLNEYYEEVSYGKLRLHADIMEPYTCEYSIAEVTEAAGTSPEQDIIRAALEYYDGEIDYSRYDNDGDGDIDCPYLIYLAPMKEYNRVESDKNTFWAFNSWFEDDTREYDGRTLSQYLWMSLDFFDLNFYEEFQVPDPDNTDGVYANCETLIHETGHALGLDDYYKTAPNETDYIGQTEMMDSNIGSLTAYSRMLLGWVDPEMVCYTEAEFTIGSLEESGDTIVIARDTDASLFGEYFTVSLYTPTGPNEAKSAMGFGLFSAPGIAVYHITNDLKPGTPSEKVGNCRYFKKPNISLFRNCVPHYSRYNRTAADGELFAAGDSVTLYWDDNTPAMTLTVNSVGADGAKVSITLPE